MGLRYLLIRRGSTKRQLNPGLHCNVKIEFCNDYQTFYINNVLSRESIEDDLTKQVYVFSGPLDLLLYVSLCLVSFNQNVVHVRVLKGGRGTYWMTLKIDVLCTIL